MMVIKNALDFFPFSGAVGQRFGPTFQSHFHSSEFLLPNKKGGAFDMLHPNILDYLHEIRLFDPERDKSEGNRAKIEMSQELKLDGFVISGATGENMYSSL
jgi:hypothetical protein